MPVPFPRAVEAFPRLRQSLLANFDLCGLAAKFDIEHRQDWSGHRAAGGQILHRAIGRCLEVMHENGEDAIPLEIAMTLYDEVVRQAEVPLNGDSLGDSDVTVPMKELADMRVALRTWAGNPLGWSTEQFVGIERRYDVTISYPDGAGGMVDRVLTTKPDLLEITADGETAVVWDWKSGWHLPAENSKEGEYDDDDLGPSGFFQQRCHALIVFLTYPRIQRVVTNEVYPRWMGSTGKAHPQTGEPINPVRTATIYRHELPEIQTEFAALIERFDRAYEHNVWTPAPGSHCSWCVRPEACTIFPAARAEGRIASAEEAERLAGRLAVLDALKRQTTKALRAWAGEHGDIPVKNPKAPKVYGPVVRQQTTKPTLEQVQAAIANGVDVGELYVTKDVAKFTVHAPAEVHPHVAAVRAEEEALLAEQRAEADRREAVR